MAFGGQDFGNRPPAQGFQGNWKCMDCGKEITSLPFQPRDENRIRCTDCHRKFQASRPPRDDFRR